MVEREQDEVAAPVAVFVDVSPLQKVKGNDGRLGMYSRQLFLGGE